MTVVTAGNLVVAGSVVAMLAAAPRVLGHEAFVGFSLSWTATTLFGYGLAMPTEQLISRRLNADVRGRTGHATSRLLALAMVCSLASWVWAAGSVAGETYGYMGPAIIVGIWAWTFAAVVRGRVAGRGDLQAYASLFGAEALIRAALVVAGLAFRAHGDLLLGCSVGLPILLAGGIGLALFRPFGDREARATERDQDGSEQLAFVIIAVGYQVCLTGAPLVLAWRVGPAAQIGVGAFVVASSYFRLASVLASGFATPALVSLSRDWARGDPTAFSHHLGRAMGGIAIVALAMTILAAALSPVALPLLYGRSLDISTNVSVALAASTVVATTAFVASTALMAVGRGPVAALCWLAGAVVLLGAVALDTEIGIFTALGTVAGPALALIGLLFTSRRMLRVWRLSANRPPGPPERE